MHTRREWLQVLAGGLVFGGALQPLSGLVAAPQNAGAIEIWKTSTCGCCRLWVDHVRAHGFTTAVHDVDDVAPFKRKYGVPSALASCHTGLVGGYAIEGHVPADLIQQVLKTRPNIAGLAVPGMPMGSPGMEGSRKDPYNVMAFDKTGKTSVFAKR